MSFSEYNNYGWVQSFLKTPNLLRKCLNILRTKILIHLCLYTINYFEFILNLFCITWKRDSYKISKNLFLIYSRQNVYFNSFHFYLAISSEIIFFVYYIKHKPVLWEEL